MLNLNTLIIFIVVSILVFFTTTFFSILINNIAKKMNIFNKYIEALLLWIIFIIYILILKEVIVDIHKYIFNNKTNDQYLIDNMLIIFAFIVPIITPHQDKLLYDLKEIKDEITLFFNL
jgi:hypothetical protein